jgi:hypothetical protein
MVGQTEIVYKYISNPMEEIGMVHVRTVDCMYCRADVHFIVFYILALRDAFSKVQYSISRVFFFPAVILTPQTIPLIGTGYQ